MDSKFHMLCLIFLAAAARCTIDSFIGFAARSQLVAITSNHNERLAWVETLRGVSNVWVATLPSGDARRATSLTDPTLDLAGLRWISGEQLTFSLSAHAGVNMAACASGAGSPGGTFVATLTPTNATVVRVSSDTAIAASAPCVGDPCALIYAVRPNNASGADVWETRVDRSGAATPPRRLFGVQQGTIDAVRPSPGSERAIAFSNNRQHHGFIGVWMEASGAHVIWIDPSVETDSSPRWAPGGRLLAWLRVRPPVGDDGFGAYDADQGNRGPDFQIMVANLTARDELVSAAAVGSLLRVARAVQPRSLFVDEVWGTPRFGYGRRGLWFPTETAVYFGTERLSNWLHLAKVDVVAFGEAPRNASELRGGACEDREWAIAGSVAYISHNCDEIDSRGLVSVNLADGMATPIVVGNTTTVAGMSNSAAGDPNGGIAVTANHVAWLQSSWNAPAAVRVAPIGDFEAVVTITDDERSAPGWLATAARMVRPTVVTFPATDGAFTLHAQIWTPPHAQPNGRAVVYTHGGSERQFFAAFHFSPVYAQQYAAQQFLAVEGNMTVISVNYRSGVGCVLVPAAHLLLCILCGCLMFLLLSLRFPNACALALPPCS